MTLGRIDFARRGTQGLRDERRAVTTGWRDKKGAVGIFLFIFFIVGWLIKDLGIYYLGRPDDFNGVVRGEWLMRFSDKTKGKERKRKWAAASWEVSWCLFGRLFRRRLVGD